MVFLDKSCRVLRHSYRMVPSTNIKAKFSRCKMLGRPHLLFKLLVSISCVSEQFKKPHSMAELAERCTSTLA